MSELKEVKFHEMNLIKLGLRNDKLYFKSEADKVIAEKDAQILALDAEVVKQKHHAKLFFDERNYAETQLRHSNHNRCLTMARWCAACRFAWSFMPDDDEVKAECKFYEKWKRRWQELANEPTWAKFLQLIHKGAK